MGLLKTAATVAVASSVHGRISVGSKPGGPRRARPRRMYPPRHRSTRPRRSRRSLRRAVPPPQAPAAPAQPADMNDRLAQLKQLGELLSAGVLTQAEFEQQKARILNG